MENTLENKAKFFAQYWGQKILRWSQWVYDAENSTVNFQVPMSTNVGIDKGWFLELTPLSLITDEDAKFLGYPDAKSATTTYDNSLGHFAKDSDYLRSKGYALPWMGLSVEQLIEYGWVKLK